ncbi:MAG: DUF4955 domain-containing protein [Bacteroides sp.]|nr:DUF4955 domain-containing protein [Bacteroides sp.]
MRKTDSMKGLLALCCLALCTACNTESFTLTASLTGPAPVTPPDDSGETLPPNTSTLWKEFLTLGETGEETTLADFSYAGYAFGETEVPDVDYPVYNVCHYGAVPDDGQGDRPAFEAAIAAAQAFGRGVVYAPAGRYDLRPTAGSEGSIVISGNNIILRGDGCGEEGTVFYMEHPQTPENAGKLWSCPPLFIFRYLFDKDKEFAVDEDYVDRKLADVVADAARGTHTVEVSSTSGLYIGKRVMLRLQNNDPALVAAEVAPYDVQPEWTDLLDNGVQVTEYHQIQRISGRFVTFKEPILYPVEARWGWTLHEHSCKVGCGVEDIAFVGNFREPFVHHQDATHDSGFKMLTFLRQVNGWVRRCRFTDVSEAVSVQRSANVSVYDCRITGNQGHSAIRSEASTRIFIGAIVDQPAQYHSTGISKTAIGTVLWRNETAANSCFESHAYQPRVTLIDACTGGLLPDHAGGDQPAAPNHLRELVLWNYVNKGGATGTFDLWTRNNRFLLPVIVGLQGAGLDFLPSQVTLNEMPGTAAYPESLYEAQLERRLGHFPEWLQKLK